eukprot:TRINITY_DN46136_c0_g1_i1.p1 TRINITY_DN46136_c0_g1~~TRINITY_DN46136_c0_g1_i1.p1  ORF type:complete len:675 (-),score=121.60 TRINITY_DN46136_c0_g1_i1:123-2147(-)
MQIAVANGAWRHGSILSVRIGDVRRQAPLQYDTRLTFPKLVAADAADMQVDVFARVGSTRIPLETARELYDLDIDGEGFSSMAIRVNQSQDEPVDLASPSSQHHRSYLDDSLAGDSIERHDLRKLATDALVLTKTAPSPPLGRSAFDLSATAPAAPQGAPLNRSRPTSRGGRSATSVGTTEMTEERLRRLRQNATEYIERYNLRMVLQDLFQRTIKDRPENPYKFMRGILCEVDGNVTDSEGQRHRSLQDAPVGPRGMASVEADAKEEELRTKREQGYREQIETQLLQIEALRNRNEELEQIVMQDAAVATASAAQRERDRSLEDARLETHRAHVSALHVRIEDLEKQLVDKEAQIQQEPTNTIAAVTWMEERMELEHYFDKQMRAKEMQVESLQQRVQQLEVGRSTPADPTAINTHMMSSLIASSYAPPVPPATYYEEREDVDQDTDAKPMFNPELLVGIEGCKDPLANGVFACVGDCNSRPLYRLLGPEPRYLYYACIDPTWQGWWIADKMGSQDYIEWFSNPADAKLPTYCKKGELGSRVTEASLTRDVVQQIGKVGSHQEKTTIRKKLVEAFGAQFSKLDGTQRGLMSKTSPVVAVAHALEAQQRAIQLLHSQLAVATQQREAAESHAATMEEAFETLQLRIQAQMPGGSSIPQYGAGKLGGPGAEFEMP